MPINSHQLAARHRILRGIREFFWSRGFLEIETPTVLAYPSQEPYLEPLRTTMRDHRGRVFNGFLRMSQEFSLKKLIVGLQTAGHKPTGAFEIGSVFRDGEPWGGSHNPEFTMLEWYRLGAAYRDLMNDCEALVLHCASALHAPQRQGIEMLPYQGQRISLARPWQRLTMRQAWQRYAHLNLDRLLTRTAMAAACRAKGYTATLRDSFDDLFFKIHLTEIEPKLGRAKPTFLYDWPLQMAALARRKTKDPRYAERVELYIGGLEIANGFSELTNADEQLRRFRADQRLRRKLGKPIFPIDPDFIAALRRLPPCAGLALGVDRLVMLLTNAASIEEVRWLPASKLFYQQVRNA